DGAIDWLGRRLARSDGDTAGRAVGLLSRRQPAAGGAHRYRERAGARELRAAGPGRAAGAGLGVQVLGRRLLDLPAPYPRAVDERLPRGRDDRSVRNQVVNPRPPYRRRRRLDVRARGWNPALTGASCPDLPSAVASRSFSTLSSRSAFSPRHGVT